MINFNQYIIKRKIENLIIYPFIILGRLKHIPKRSNYDIIFFIPSFHTGGAERVHLQIAEAFRNKKCLLVFTKKSKNKQFFDDYKKTKHTIIDISNKVDNKFKYWNNLIWRGALSRMINNHLTGKVIILNCQSNFGYKISPWIKKEIKQVDLIHAFSNFSKIRIPFIEYYFKTIMISHKCIEEHKSQYLLLKVPPIYFNRFVYISNGIKFKILNSEKSKSDKLRILYVGRNSPEKRIEIILKTAELSSKLNLPLKFTFVCDLNKFQSYSKTSNCIFLGEIYETEKLFSIYAENDILILSSLNEGFPLVIMEGMANGCTILSTPVGDIPYHIKNDQNGYLTENVLDENRLINEFINILNTISTEKLKSISHNNIQYAINNFSIDTFNQKYTDFLNNCINEN